MLGKRGKVGCDDAGHHMGRVDVIHGFGYGRAVVFENLKAAQRPGEGKMRFFARRRIYGFDKSEGCIRLDTVHATLTRASPVAVKNASRHFKSNLLVKYNGTVGRPK